MTARRPRVLRNQWGALTPPALGAWTPSRSVSVVVPAYDSRDTLALTLASLARQTYPAELLEVIVVDDGENPHLADGELPALRPDRTRLVRTEQDWGRAYACAVGAAEATGEVLHWFDADMVAEPEQVESQLRWHHLLDHAVVLGQKTFVDPAEGLPSPDAVAACADGLATAALFADRWQGDHEWIEEYLGRTRRLRFAKWRGYRVHTGATASVDRILYERAGGMDPAMKLGEDIELGYRLQSAGALFVPDGKARSWHLGRTQVMERAETVNRYNGAFFADRVPDLRYLRTAPGRSYTVPYLEVTLRVPTGPQAYERTAASLDALLGAEPSDLRVHLVADWDRLDAGRRAVLADPDADLRMLAARYAGDPRVVRVAAAPTSAFPATFALDLPAGWVPGEETVLALVNRMQRQGWGLLQVLLPDRGVVRLTRTAAVERARRLAAPGEDLDDVIDAVAGSWWAEGVEEGFVPVS